MKYKFFLVDLDNTLFDFDKCEHYGISELCCEIGFPFTEKFYSDYSRINLKYWERFERGEVTKAELNAQRFEEVFSLYGTRFDGTLATEIYHKYLSKANILIDDALETVKALAENGEVYICTNGDTDVQKSRIGSSPISGLLKGIFISDEIGAQKPSKEYFDAVFNVIGDKEKAIIIGDSLTSDIKGGNDAGIDTCYFNRASKPDRPGIHPTYTVKKLSEILCLPGIKE